MNLPASKSGDPLALYYLLATPVFAIVDLAGGPSLRVAAIPTVTGRLAYYGALIVLGVVAYRRPRLAPWVGMGESATNLFLLLLSILLPIWSLGDLAPMTATAPGTSPTPLDTGLLGTADLVSATISGTVLVWSFYRNQERAIRRA